MERTVTPLKQTLVGDLLARNHINGHDSEGRIARGAEVAEREEFERGRHFVRRQDPAHGAMADSVTLEHEGPAGDGKRSGPR